MLDLPEQTYQVQTLQLICREPNNIDMKVQYYKRKVINYFAAQALEQLVGISKHASLFQHGHLLLTAIDPGTCKKKLFTAVI